MTESTYRPGDFAMVKWDEDTEKIAVCIDNGPTARPTWMALTHEWTVMPHAVGPILGNVSDIAELRGILAEVDLAHLPVQLEEARGEVASLARWKEEAMPVMDGLQELGKALRLPLGQRITGPAALEAVQQLHDAAQAFLDAYDAVGCEVWWPDEVEPLREVLER
jgi:hypothetical protein